MTRSFIRIGVVIMSSALVALVSCSTFRFPSKECHPEPIVDGPERTYADRSNCSRCLELACCDEIGHCSENQAGCVDPFRLVLRKIQADQAFELRYLEELPEQPRNLYRCLRKDCAKECGVPSCDLSPAVAQLGTPKCDQCITASCCEQINSCYENRRCKLTLECIITRCGKQLGESLEELENHPEARDLFTQKFCSNSRLDEPPKNCLDECLYEYTTNDREDPEARCAAAGTYACAAKASCARHCKPDSPTDAAADAPADAPGDSSADAHDE